MTYERPTLSASPCAPMQPRILPRIVPWNLRSWLECPQLGPDSRARIARECQLYSNFTLSDQCHTVFGSTISLVNVRDHCDNHRALAHAIPALRWARWSRTGSAAARAFAFLGRCFDVALPRDVSGPRLRQRMMRRSVKSREVGGHPQSPLRARVAASAQPPLQSIVCRQGAATPANGPMSGPHPCTDAAHDPSGAALCRDRSEQAGKPTMRMAHERAPGSTNAPLHARSRPTVLFHRCLGWLKGSHVGSLGVTR
jgi:hypothetical protein